MLIQVDSHKVGHIAYTFDNGIRLSMTFAAMTYSDNYDEDMKDIGSPVFSRRPLKSKTVEIMQTDGNPALNAWIHKKYGTYAGGDDPIGYVEVKNIPAILKRADSKVYKKKG